VSRLLLRPVVIALFVYLFTLGATFNGILSPEIPPLTLALVGILLACWLFVRWRQGWTWHRTPLDVAFLLWIVAFGLSLAANLDAARRIAIGLWYVGLYIGIWYVVQDCLANAPLLRDGLVDGLFVSGFIIIVLAYWQLLVWLTRASNISLGLSTLPRPVSLFGNPNFLSAFLIVLIPFLLSRLFLSRSRFQRIVLGLYAALSILLLFLTYSRAAWLGMAAGGAVWIGLLLAYKGLLSRNKLTLWWQAQSRLWRTALLAGGIMAVLIGGAVAFIFIRSFSQAGRTADLRGDIYTAALELFAEKPITGQGLFTFGRGLVRLPDVQPDKPHSHAHNAVLHIAAELGIVGLIALGATLWVMARVMRSNWRAMQGHDRIMLAGAVGAVVAFAVDQLGDIPAMMPAIALVGLIALMLALAPHQPEALTVRWTRRGFPFGIAVLWVILLVSGLWSNRVYAQYVGALSYAISSKDYTGAAQGLQPVIDADPNLSLYSLEQAFLLGMEASSGDLDAAREATAVYKRFIALDPGYALAWANMAGLQWQLGEQEAAVKSIQQAIYLDSNVWQYYLNLARYSLAMGDTDTANQAYDKILQLNADVSLYPDYTELTQRRLTSNVIVNFSTPAQVVLLLENQQVEQAVQAWQQNILPESTASDMIQVLLALAQQDRDCALRWLARGEAISSHTPDDEAWVHLGRSRIAAFIGENALASSEVDNAHKALIRQPLDSDDDITINIAYAQFMRLAIPRLFLPQVDYRVDDPVLLHLLVEGS
jgi:O-antigen ligase/tetratricopeptide (TPR) repeat protein